MAEQIYELKISDHGYLTGFEKVISGATIDYHSLSPDIRPALLTRANTGQMAIEWQTEPVAFTDNQKEVKFIWVAGLGCNLGTNNFDFYINGQKEFTFQTLNKGKWEVTSGNKKLAFETVLIDNAKDRFGMMTLCLPVETVKPGKPLDLKIVGKKENSDAWVMTFKDALKEKITLLPTKALLRHEKGRMQPISMNLIYFGESKVADIQVEGAKNYQIKLDKMFNRFTIPVPEVKKPRKLTIQITINDKEILNDKIYLEPVEPFTMHLVQHTHTDIGYTRPQTEILAEHLRYIDYALDYCDQTDHYPEDAKFRWTCEASWPVREYLQNRPKSQIERLRKRVQEGRIELTGMMFNMSEIADEASYVDFVKVIGGFKKNGMPVKTAMQNDVNGFAWALVDYFQHTGVEYLSMGTHGHKALIAFDHPTPFWMESPSGNRLLAFRADHYMTGNRFGIHGEDFNNFETELFKYLDKLFEKGYPYDEIAVQYSGYMTDNSPPGLAGCEMIRKWNEKYEWPKLRSAVAMDFLDNLKENHAEELPVYRAAWPDWWTDGAGSAARETAASRHTHSEMIANLGLLSMAKLAGAELPSDINEKITEIQDAVLFYDEHTYGAAESVSDPMAENSRVQWMEKSAYVWNAVKNSRLLTEYAMGHLQPYLPKSDVPTLAVFNTLNWERSGLLEVFIDNEILPRDKKFRIVDEKGNELDAQIIGGRAEGNRWAIWLEDIPALGYKTFRIETQETLRDLLPEYLPEDFMIENEFYRLKIDQENGAVASLFDKNLNMELADNSGKWKLGQLIYELAGPRGQLDRFTLDEFSRGAWQNISVEKGVNGPIWKSIVIEGYSDGFDEKQPIRLEIRLFNKTKRIEFHYFARKKAVKNPESVYIAFPFQMQNAKLKYEVQGGLVEPGKDQVPGSSSDWNTFQNFITVQSKKGQIVWGSEEMPLVHLGGINLGKFMYIAKYEKPHIYSWPMNNIWVTNFRPYQEGDHRWSYYMTSGEDNSEDFAGRFGWGSRVPFPARVIPPSPKKEKMISASFLNIAAENILLISARPSKDNSGIILQLRETAGEKVEVSSKKILNGVKFNTISQVNVLEEEIDRVRRKISFNPYEVKFIKITM